LKRWAEASVVIRLDLREGASGPDAMDADSIDADTLEELQHQALAGRGAEGSRLVDIPGLLIVDDASAFARHAQALRYLLEAPTFRQMTCVIVGPPASPPELDVPLALDFHRVPVLWVGDPRGVGWRIGQSKPDRIAVSPDDPDGSKTIAEVLDALMVPEVYDHVSGTLGALPFRFGVPALLPWVRWPATAPAPASGPVPPEPAAPDPQAPDPPGPEPTPPGTAPQPERRRNPLIRFLLWLLALLGLRRHASPSATAEPAIHMPEMAPQGPEPPAGHQVGPAPVSDDDLAHARWLMSAAAEDNSFRQLCSARQVITLGGDARQARLVRFAPAAARELIECPVRAGDVAWTGGEVVGVIRLVPVRAGLLRFA
jgi:hypothetical protein